MKKLYKAYLLIFIASTIFAQEQETLPIDNTDITTTMTNISILSEQDFLNSYLENSFHNKIAIENLSIADQKINIAFEPYTGSFFIDTGFAYGNTTNPLPIYNILTNGTPVSQDIAVDYTNLSLSLGADATIYPSGTYVKVQGGVKNIDYSSQTVNINQATIPPSIEDNKIRENILTPFFNITLVQPFLKNGFAYKMHSRTIKIAKNNKKLEYIQEKIKLEEVVSAALIQYHKLILTTQIIAIREKSLSEIQDVYNTQKRLQRVGARSRFDLIQLEVKINEITVGLEEAKRNLELEFQILEDRLQMPLDRNNLNFLDYSILSEKEFTEDSIYQLALENSGDLTKLNLLLDNTDHAIQITKNQIMPELNLLFSYETFSANFSKDHPLSQGSAFKVPQDNLYIGLQFKMPLANITQKAKIKEAYAQSKSLTYNKDHLEKELGFIIKEKFAKWSNDSVRTTAQQDIVALHQEISVEALRRYNNSEISIMDFFEYEENYRQAQIKHTMDQFNQKTSLLTLEIVQGTLLDTYNITTVQ